MSIVTTALAKKHLNIDGNDDDELIALYIGAAEQFLAAYVGKPLESFDPTPVDLQLAVLMLVGFYFEQREAVSFGVTMQVAPYSVISIANSYREKWFEDAAE